MSPSDETSRNTPVRAHGPGALSRPAAPGWSLAALLSLMASLCLGSVSLLIPIHPYDWAEAPELRAQVSADAVLVVVWLAGVASCLAALSLVIALSRRGIRRSRRVGLVVSGLLALSLGAARLAEVLPEYQG
ncbi:hypothetical protein JYJ95_35045 [Corallococcus exiguus]|uniref:hypothetical protein n=1 Tax=Corallococcus exiguus TaxID=83462 RepID=UPI001A8C8B14|nr:hypothetical protein [Corallococcus exiguus]MBN8471754.1 hypothetical protein [Corallococcus exiguus]